MSIQLLDNIRKLNKLLHNSSQPKVVFNDICEIMGACLKSNMLVLSCKGKLLGYYGCEEVAPITTLISDRVGEKIDASLNDRLLDILSTNENISPETLGFDKDEVRGYTAFISPIEIAGERFGTIFLYRKGDRYDIDDIILCEYGTTVFGLEILHSESEEFMIDQRRQKDVKSAMASLSGTETEAVIQILNELNGDEGILIASKIADRTKITRSVIVNALRKLEGAGVIESHSSGMKGTYIKILNEYLFDEVENIISQRGK